MEKIKITADSICDAPESLIKAHDFAILPLFINLGEECVLDGPDVPEKIYAYANKTKSTPKTAARSIQEFKEFFQKHLPAGGSLIHFNISSEASASYNNAVMAAREVPGVYVIDSRLLSVGMTLLMLKAAKLRDEGLPAATIVEQVKASIPHTHVSFILKDLIYLHRGGRCSSTAKLFSMVLNIKPQIIMPDGNMYSGKKYMGSFDSCVKKYVKDTLETYTNPDLEYCFLIHTKLDNPQLVDEVRAQILAKYPFKQVIEAIPNGTVTSHCGPNTLGVMYVTQ